MSKNKTLFLALAMIFSVAADGSMSSAAGNQADKVLYCQGGNGGPRPATVVLSIRQVAQGEYLLRINLKNVIFPNGIEGVYSAKRNVGEINLHGVGGFGALNSRIILSPNSRTGNYKLSVYANGNHDVEFGYGAHFTCN